MIALWESLIKPIADAIDAKTVLEVGADYGLSTRALLDYVAPKSGHLFSIDTAPGFDVDKLTSLYPGFLSFSDEPSLSVIPRLPQLDIVLLDGDHNWYTVINELRTLENVQTAERGAMPVVLLHDIGWPYARRDLYYAPERIPDSFIHPYARKGIGRNRHRLLESGGLNANMFNALQEGGARNGVLTAVEDYLAESDIEYEFIQLPIYYGLGILVPGQRVKANQKLRELLETYRSYLAATPLLELTERLRLNEVANSQRQTARLQSRDAPPPPETMDETSDQ
ncbi:class I SAM-dependent methyltransferase [Halioglobus pacificus]|uniref:Uncharacterized protein n=1 Tax=Parahalioglobus pacificus TaxID=930806 RepID=A0A919CKV1_9GAMM|nr:class I SAM-dependent methyltransferase [Halioglobus pacificus]GHD31928.1 hypothetical protein GCM10007053_15500 [Halioglobus pacificus]